MNFNDIISETNVLVNRYLAGAQEVLPEDLGLDRRAGYRFFVTEEMIAVTKDDDVGLQYYGGFEYVDKDYRTEIGEWVFYSAEDDRVAGHLSRIFDEEFA
jgi:hypothetical protein